MELSSSNIKKFPIFSQKKTFVIFPETKTTQNSVIFQKTEHFYISGGTSKSPEKQNFLYFSKKSYE